jgi:hypothetical protein
MSTTKALSSADIASLKGLARDITHSLQNISTQADLLFEALSHLEQHGTLGRKWRADLNISCAWASGAIDYIEQEEREAAAQSREH